MHADMIYSRVSTALREDYDVMLRIYATDVDLTVFTVILPLHIDFFPTDQLAAVLNATRLFKILESDHRPETGLNFSACRFFQRSLQAVRRRYGELTDRVAL